MRITAKTRTKNSVKIREPTRLCERRVRPSRPGSSSIRGRADRRGAGIGSRIGAGALDGGAGRQGAAGVTRPAAWEPRCAALGHGVGRVLEIGLGLEVGLGLEIGRALEVGAGAASASIDDWERGAAAGAALGAGSVINGSPSGTGAPATSPPLPSLPKSTSPSPTVIGPDLR